MTNETQTAAPVSLGALEQKWRDRAEYQRKTAPASTVPDYRQGLADALEGCADELATRRLAQSGMVGWPERMVNLPCPDGTTDRIVGFRVPEGSPILGKFGLSEPIAWLRSVTVDRTHPAAVDEAMMRRAMRAKMTASTEVRDFVSSEIVRVALTAALQPAPSENES